MSWQERLRLALSPHSVLSIGNVALKHFKEVAELLSTANATLGNVISEVGLLKKKISEFHQNQTLAPQVQDLVNRLAEQIGTWMEPLLGNPLYHQFTICEPRVKGKITRRNYALGSLNQKLIERSDSSSSGSLKHYLEDAVECASTDPPLVYWAYKRHV